LCGEDSCSSSLSLALPELIFFFGGGAEGFTRVHSGPRRASRPSARAYYYAVSFRNIRRMVIPRMVIIAGDKPSANITILWLAQSFCPNRPEIFSAICLKRIWDDPT